MSYEPSYEDQVTVEIMDWALDTMPDQVKGMTLEDIADKYWKVHLSEAESADAFSVLSDFDEDVVSDLTATYGKQPDETY